MRETHTVVQKHWKSGAVCKEWMENLGGVKWHKREILRVWYLGGISTTAIICMSLPWGEKCVSDYVHVDDKKKKQEEFELLFVGNFEVLPQNTKARWRWSLVWTGWMKCLKYKLLHAIIFFAYFNRNKVCMLQRTVTFLICASSLTRTVTVWTKYKLNK